MGEISQARVCAWCFDMQLRTDPNDVSDCFCNIVHDAQIPSKIPLDMVSFAWSPDATWSLVGRRESLQRAAGKLAACGRGVGELAACVREAGNI